MKATGNENFTPKKFSFMFAQTLVYYKKLNFIMNKVAYKNEVY